MTTLEPKIENDVLIRKEYSGGGHIKKTNIITKEEFILAYNTWIKEEKNGSK